MVKKRVLWQNTKETKGKENCNLPLFITTYTTQLASSLPIHVSPFLGPKLWPRRSTFRKGDSNHTMAASEAAMQRVS